MPGRTRAHQTTAQGCFQLYFLHELSDLAYRLRRALTVAESSEKDYFDTEKLIIEGKKYFWGDLQLRPYIFYETVLMSLWLIKG